MLLGEDLFHDNKPSRTTFLLDFQHCLDTHVFVQVDFVLLGGDLFHDNKPSRTTLVRAMEVLSKYCLQPKPIDFKLLSDENKAFVSRCMHTSTASGTCPVLAGQPCLHSRRHTFLLGR